MAKHRKSRRTSKRSRRTTKRHRRTYGGAWYDPRTWFSETSTNNTSAVSPLAPKSTMSNLFAPTRNRTRSVSPVLPSQEGSRYLIPKTRFAAENTVYTIPTLGSSPVGNSSKTSTARRRPNMAANVFKPSSRGAENALVARHVAELFQRSNSNQNMLNYLDTLQVAPHVKNRIRNQFLRNYGNAFNNNV